MGSHAGASAGRARLHVTLQLSPVSSFPPQLILGQSTPSDDGAEQSPPIRLTLDRINDGDDDDDGGGSFSALSLATHLCADLIRTNTILHSSLTRTQSKLTHARVLAGIDSGAGGVGSGGGASSYSQGHSLVNPGRIKRKRDDDEGFEGDSSRDSEDTETEEEE